VTTEYAVVADLLRRAGCFEDAVVQIDWVVEEAEGDTAAVLAFSRSRAVARDAAAYTVEDALAAQA
jgi:hypothetical protein